MAGANGKTGRNCQRCPQLVARRPGLFALGDFSGSLELIEKILQVDPDHGEARDYLRQNEATLI